MNNNIFFIFIAGFLITACQLGGMHESGQDADMQSATLVDAKYSLTKDRAELDKIRESIPADIKKHNDEKALTAEWFGEVKYSPEVIREKYSNLVRKKRELFNRDMTRSREDYNKKEKKSREEFLNNVTEERKDFLRKKTDRDNRTDFFNRQDEARRTFMAEIRESRDEFETDFREKRKNFDDYLREKNDDFVFELKNYAIKWKEKLDRDKERETQQ